MNTDYSFKHQHFLDNYNLNCSSICGMELQPHVSVLVSNILMSPITGLNSLYNMYSDIITCLTPVCSAMFLSRNQCSS